VTWLDVAWLEPITSRSLSGADSADALGKDGSATPGSRIDPPALFGAGAERLTGLDSRMTSDETSPSSSLLLRTARRLRGGFDTAIKPEDEA
jgi:hypothetical protein